MVPPGRRGESDRRQSDRGSICERLHRRELTREGQCYTADASMAQPHSELRRCDAPVSLPSSGQSGIHNIPLGRRFLRG